jgi:hypothetical protein
MCTKPLEGGWITVARKFCGQVWLEHFCPQCHEAATVSYEQNLKDREMGYDELPEETHSQTPLPQARDN